MPPGNNKSQTIKHLKKYFLIQRDQTDCGVTCLANIIHYHGGEARIEKLRELSGTNKQGTTLLGLYQASLKSGFRAEGLKADTDYLKKTGSPVILHVVIDDRLHHYLVIYSWSDGRFLAGDPARGIYWINEKELTEIWQSRSLLELQPVEGKLKKKADYRKEMKLWFIELIREDSTILLTIFVTGIIVSVLGIAIAVYSQTLIDKLIPAGNIARIVIATTLVIIILIFRAFINYFRQSFTITQSRDINIRIINNFFSSLLRQPMLFFNSRQTGDMVARLNDTTRIQQTVTYVVGELLINALLLLVSLIAVYLYFPLAGIILSAGMPLYLLAARYFHPSVIEKQHNVMAAHAKNESNYITTIENAPVIKTSNKESLFATLGRNIYAFFQHRIFSLGKTGISINILTEITGIFLIMGVIAASISAMLSNDLQTGEFIAVLTLANNIVPAGAALAYSNIQLQSARVAFERMYEFSAGEQEYDIETDSKAKKIRKFEYLELGNITFRFPGRKLLLEDVSLSLKKGEMKTIFGENGTGKSTLLNIIQGFFAPGSGTIKLNGEDITRFSVRSYRGIMGVVPQQISLFNTTIIENIIMDNSQDAVKLALGILEKHSLTGMFEQFPNGLASMVEERGMNISGGQAKLIGLARALCTDPQLLLVDEITSSADRNTENFIINLFRNLKNEVPVLQVTHNLKAASISDEIIVLDKGRITCKGNHNELMQTDNLYSLSWRDYLRINC